MRRRRIGTTSHEDRGVLRGEVEVGPVTERIEIQFTPQQKLTVGASLQAEHLDSQARGRP